VPIYKANGKKDGKEKYIVRINYIADDGKPKQLTRIACGSGAAKDLELRLYDEIRIKNELPIKKMTVQELFDEYIEVKKYETRQRTIYNIRHVYNAYISPTFKNYRIDRITVRDIQQWKIAIEKKNLALATKKRAFIYFSAMINFAIRMEYLLKNPLTKIGNFKDVLTVKAKMNFYTPQEFEKFIRVAKKSAEEKEQLKNDLSEWNYYVFFNIAFYTGLRKGEIHALKWLDIEGQFLTVSRSISQSLKKTEGIETAPKNHSSVRTIQIPLPLIKIFSEHKERQKRLLNFNEDFRICSSVKDTTIQRRNELYSTTAKIKSIRIHDFRHSHASLLASSNINIQEVARRLGHSRIEMTWNTYCHLYPQEEEKAIKVLNGFTY